MQNSSIGSVSMSPSSLVVGLFPPILASETKFLSCFASAKSHAFLVYYIHMYECGYFDGVSAGKAPAELLVSRTFFFSRATLTNPLYREFAPPHSCNFTSVQSEILSCDVIIVFVCVKRQKCRVLPFQDY